MDVDPKSDQVTLSERDVLLVGGTTISSEQKTDLLLQDMIRLQHILWSLQGKAAPKKLAQIDDIADKVHHILIQGKDYELAGFKEVPAPYLKSKGRIVEVEGEEYKIMSDDEAKKALKKIILEEFKNDLPDFTESPFKEFKDMWERKADVMVGDVTHAPDNKDAILLRTDDSFTGDKAYDQHGANKVLFNLASQLVTIEATTSDKRIAATFEIMKGLEDAEIHSEDPARKVSKYPRYLVRNAKDDNTLTWATLSLLEAAEFVLTFAFEVLLEKDALPSNDKVDGADSDTAGPSKEPVPEPTDHDVLFGRGGMTNSHIGNRRFRDIIALHRPDYIRAIKMEKPNVARKIVKAIRTGNPAGRFLKKGDDGMWYDVGDRLAAEKTSQGLRERSNAEKRQRQELRRALRIRKEDLEETADTPGSGKKARITRGIGLSPVENATVAAANVAATLNYVGTTISVPLSLNMPPIVATARKKTDAKGRPTNSEFSTEGLPPNAVDSEGNILVTDYDILCGRGGLTNHHKGNKRFRDIVALHRPDYVRAPKIQKPSVARVIVRAIRNGDPPGRFLRKDEKTGKWVDVGDKKAAEKTSQALREKSNDERDNIKRDPAQVDVLLPNPASYVPATTTATVMGKFLASAINDAEPRDKSNDGEGALKGDDEAEKDDEVQTEVV